MLMKANVDQNPDVTKLPSLESGGLYLLVADDSKEFDVALQRVAVLAKQNLANVGLLYVIDQDDFSHWNFVQNKINTDKRAEAEKMLWDIADRLYKMTGQVAGFYIKEGKTRQQILDVLSNDSNIRGLVLGARDMARNPLVKYFANKGLSSLRVPLIIIPEKAKPLI